jgi:hypothetical protein
VLPFAMGRAYSAVADDWLALHYNPAGLAVVEGVDFQILDAKLGVSSDAVNNFGEYKKLGSSGSDAQKLTALSGKRVHANLGNVTQLTIPKFAVALVYDNRVDFDNRNQVYPQIRVRNTLDTGFVTGIGVGVGRANNRQKALRLGMSLKYLKRRGGVKDLTVANISNNTKALLDQFQATGWGLGATFGMQYQLPVSGRAEYTISFVYHDIGNTSFGSFSQKDRPTPIEQNMTTGFAMRFPIGGSVNRRAARRFGQPRSTNHLTMTAEYSHLNIGTDREHLPKHLHFGLNLDLPIISLQAGWNQTSPTFGLSLDLSALRVSAASYAEDIGGYGGQIRDRRYLISVGTGFGFSQL